MAPIYFLKIELFFSFVHYEVGGTLSGSLENEKSPVSHGPFAIALCSFLGTISNYITRVSDDQSENFYLTFNVNTRCDHVHILQKTVEYCCCATSDTGMWQPLNLCYGLSDWVCTYADEDRSPSVPPYCTCQPCILALANAPVFVNMKFI